MKEYTVKVTEDGSKFWRLHGKLHREDGPAVEYASGTKEWWLHNKLHREDGPAVEWEHGTKEWWLHGKMHREDGPAYEHPGGCKKWYLKGEQHREDGPAVEYAHGTKEWWLHGEYVTEEEHKRQTSGVTMDDAPPAGDAVILREQAEKIAELEERISWLETTLDTVDAALSNWRQKR